MSGKVVDPDNARLVAMLRAMGEEVPEDLLRKPEAKTDPLAGFMEFSISPPSKKSGETWTLEMDISFRDADESNEPDYLPPVRKPITYNGSFPMRGR